MTSKQLMVFGTGGETISCNLYLADLADLTANNLSGATFVNKGVWPSKNIFQRVRDTIDS